MALSLNQTPYTLHQGNGVEDLVLQGEGKKMGKTGEKPTSAA
jgi:hypothetical protein